LLSSGSPLKLPAGLHLSRGDRLDVEIQALGTLTTLVSGKEKH